MRSATCRFGGQISSEWFEMADRDVGGRRFGNCKSGAYLSRDKIFFVELLASLSFAFTAS